MTVTLFDQDAEEQPDIAPGQATLFGADDDFKVAYQLWRGMPACDMEDLTAWKSLLVNFESRQDLEAFKKLIDQPRIGVRTKSIWYPYVEWEMVVETKRWIAE